MFAYYVITTPIIIIIITIIIIKIIITGPVEKAAGHVLAMSRITLHHLVKIVIVVKMIVAIVKIITVIVKEDFCFQNVSTWFAVSCLMFAHKFSPGLRARSMRW